MSVKVTFVGSGDAFGAGGRFQTCILVQAPGSTFAIDFGCSSLIALNKLGIDHNAIDTIVLTHLHGDHAGGIPFMLMDAMLGAKRTKPLTIAGPRETKNRLAGFCEVLFPGMNVMTPKFELDYVEMPVMKESIVGDLKITPYPAYHTGETNPTCVRVEVAGKVVAYTGDSDWTKHMPKVAKDADLFIAECYYYQKPIRFHLNYPTIQEHWGELEAKRIILTHFSREMMLFKDQIPEETASDGLEVVL